MLGISMFLSALARIRNKTLRNNAHHLKFFTRHIMMEVFDRMKVKLAHGHKTEQSKCRSKNQEGIMVPSMGCIFKTSLLSVR